MALLEVRGITIRFGGHVALDSVDIDVESGSVTGLIGPNGAGKTTLFNVITGLQPSNGGRVILDGKDLGRLPPYKRARLGLARTFQRLELFTHLTLRENILVAADLRSRFARIMSRADATTVGSGVFDDVDSIIDLVGLHGLADIRVDALPTGQARLVEIARALACRPRVLLLDEPASGLNDGESEQLATLLHTLAGRGVAVLLVEHDVPLVMEVCDVIHVLDLGTVIASGSPDKIRSDSRVIAAYLGSTEPEAVR